MQVRPYRRQDFHDIAIIEKMAFGTGAYSSLSCMKFPYYSLLVATSFINDIYRFLFNYGGE